VAACPQVGRPIKDYVRGFRRVERASHWDLLVSYLVLMTTGILINHWGSELPTDLRFALGALHRIFTVGLVAAPLFLLLFDRHHFLMIARRALSWSPSDVDWFLQVRSWITSRGRSGAIKRGAYNPGQRLWYLYVPAAILAFAATGGLKWLGPQVVGEGTVSAATAVHVAVALLTDLLLLLHVYLKLLWPVLRDIARGTRQYLDTQRYRRQTALLGGR
jgi:cytochrome b subunit of formate dehydrogenase